MSLNSVIHQGYKEVRQGYKEVKLHVILVEAMGTIYRDHTYKPPADLNLHYHKI